MNDQVRVERAESGAVVRIVLDRPERRNALNASMVAKLTSELSLLDSDGDVRVVAISGAGTDFCAGFSLFDPYVAVAGGGAFCF